MKKQVYEIYEDGFLKEIYVAEVEVDEILDEDKKSFIIMDPPHGLFKAKWTGSEWIEGATQEEIDKLTKVEPSPPTQEEITNQRLADLELMLVELLSI